jgi:hypothetical protein
MEISLEKVHSWQFAAFERQTKVEFESYTELEGKK